MPPEKQNYRNVPANEKEVEVVIPFSVSGVAGDSIVTLNGAMVVIEAPDGLRWDSGWRPKGWSLFHEDKGIVVRFTLKKKLFERIKSLPVKADISLALMAFIPPCGVSFILPKASHDAVCPVPGSDCVRRQRLARR